MLNRSLMLVKCIVFIVIISLLLSSCGKGDDLPDGAKYFEPIWYENLSEYTTGNYNRISDFKEGYAVVYFAQMGEHWSVSDERCAIIDKSGEFILGPLEGDLFIDVVDGESFYIQDSNVFTSKIVDINNDMIGSFEGILSGGNVGYDGELFNEDGVSYLCCNNVISQTPYENKWTYGLAKKSGQVIVPCEYVERISSVADEYFVFLKDKEGKAADVYNSDGSFSHSIYSDYIISDYRDGLLELRSGDGYGVADIYGNIIVEPNIDRVAIISKQNIVVSSEDSIGCKLIDNKGKTLKEFEFANFSVSEMYNDIFALSNGNNTYLITDKGEFLKEYKDTYNPKYCGDGIVALSCRGDREPGIQLINMTSGVIIGDKYNDRNDIKFNEGYAVVEDLEGNKFVINKDGNKYCEGYDIIGNVSDSVVQISNDEIAGIICLPPKQ